jgi:hypothetical protein
LLWFTVFFLVILKIPIAYLAYVIWWAVKDPPDPAEGFGGASAADGGTPGGLGPGPRRQPLTGRGRGPHGSPARRPVRTAFAAGRRKDVR